MKPRLYRCVNKEKEREREIEIEIEIEKEALTQIMCQFLKLRINTDKKYKHELRHKRLRTWTRTKFIFSK